ncbi:alpha/beta hydrolase fold domain-containing protein [Sarocladium implicatum]|nr:alpha/beta hydrolase fold domain-containing protein [Sarocladium implicatum]
MDYSREQLEALAFTKAPSLHPDFLVYEKEQATKDDPGLPDGLIERRVAYAQKCRDVYQKMTAEGARERDLGRGIEKKWFTLQAGADNFNIPVMQLDISEYDGQDPEIIIFYIHGGGLAVGEADSEELSCRRMLKARIGRVRLYSLGYRLKDPWPASTCISDCLDCIRTLRDPNARTILAGSSSGGQIAAAISLQSEKGTFQGVMLRGPVTADACSGSWNIPERFRNFHTSIDDSFINSMSFYLRRRVPNDGLEKLPLDAEPGQFAAQPKTWIQVSTNDTLYCDGLCYAMALQEEGVEFRLDVIHGWPHTFWLVAPELDRSLQAEDDMVEGLRWLIR